MVFFSNVEIQGKLNLTCRSFAIFICLPALFPCCDNFSILTSPYRSTFLPLSVSLERSYRDPVFDEEGLAGFRAEPMNSLWPNPRFLLSLTCFSFS